MLSALSPSSISNAANNNHPSVDAPSIKPSSAMIDHANSNSNSNSNNNSNNPNSSNSPYNESSGMVRGSPGRDYSTESSSSTIAGVHPLSTSSSSSPSSSSRPFPQQLQQQQRRSQTPTMASTPTFQHQQLVKIKSEHGLTTPHPQQHQHHHQQQQMNAPDIVMTNEDGDEDDGVAGRDSERPTTSPMLPNAETMDEDEDGDHGHVPHHHHHHHSQQQEKTPLMVDTSSGAIHSHTNGPRGAQMAMASPNMTATPSTATLTPDSSVTNSSSRRPSLRTMTATLPRSALQEETIALFKQYRNLIPCAKCFSRNTIQRDGMSDGNLRFKCRPPVSMSLICNKSYSESKIRNMIAGVVYGHSLPESGTPSSATSSENVLALALPPNMTKSGSGRRPSQKYADANMTPDLQQSHTFQDDHHSHHNHHQDHKGDERELYQEHGRPQQGGGYEEAGDERGGRPGSRRPSSAMATHPRRPSLIGQESPMMDYEESTMMGPPSGHLQVPNTPPMEGEDPRLYRPHSAQGHRPFTPVNVHPTAASSSNSSNLGPRQGAPKLHHSHSHPNIGQQRHQQYLDQQRHIQQQQQQPRQVVRIEPAQPHHGHGSEFSRSEMAERRFSHPAALQRSPSSKYLPVAPNNTALSPALSPSSQVSPRYESGQAPASLAGPGGRYEETHSQGSYYPRRMSQPHPSIQRPYGQLPPPPVGSSHRYDRRASEVDEYNYQHLRQYERLNASTMRGGHPLKSKISPKQCSPPRSSDSPLSAQQRDGPVHAISSSAAYAVKPGYPPSSSPLMNSNVQGLRTPQAEPMRFSHSMSSIEAPGSATSGAASAGANGSRHAYQTPRQQASSSSVYYHQPSSRDDLEIRDSYAHDDSRGDQSPEDADGRLYARMRQGFRKPGMGPSIRRLGSSPNLYTVGSMIAPISSPSAKDLNSALPRNAIKLTCFPSAVTASKDSPVDGQAPGVSSVDDDLDMKMSQSSKVVIEITQPRSTFDRSSSSSSLSGFDDVPRPLFLSASSEHPRRALRHAISQPNLLIRNSSSVLERRRRSVSPSSSDRGGIDGNSGEDGFGSSKKRRADSLSQDEDVITSTPSSSSVAEAAAAAVVAAAANAARQINGQDYSKKDVIGLGVVMDGDTVTSTSGCNSPMIDALDVAKASSYVSLEDQKELGIDYSLFTRVETAAWRILIPPNVTASFRSEDFGLTLKPKAISEAAASASMASPTSAVAGGCAEITPLVAPMAAISTSETEDESAEEVQVESVEHENAAVEGDEGMDVVMEADGEEESMMTTTATTTTLTTETCGDAVAAVSVDSREEMMAEDD
ncbi:hypothetical protein KI688_005381 [Linnemannia hyalina]|uniref:Uncharacterized protein n=1 Tax=Linnemannia hyalina TaxID=64524 RepID=A0A9P7XK02_9FUNG|nr:hypothetical protein KI688_005381 [Linnemannia hyalina]